MMAKNGSRLVEMASKLTPTKAGPPRWIESLDPRQQSDYRALIAHLHITPKNKRPSSKDIIKLIKDELGADISPHTLRDHINAGAV